RKYINRKTLIELNNIMEIREDITKKAPNQEDFPLLELFYNFSLDHKLVEIEGYQLSITKRGHKFLRLSDEEKFTMFIQYLLGNKIIEYIVAKSDNGNAILTRKNLINFLYSLKEGIFYKFSELDFASLGSIRYVF